MAELVLECASPPICEIYTTLSVETFAAGASSISTLQELHKRKYLIYELGGLHAKIIIVDESFASIGSQNLTKKGGLNLEATVAISDPGEVAAIAEGIQPWLANRRLITKQMLVDVEEKVAEVAERYKAARREASRLESSLHEAIRQHRRESWAQNARRSLHERVRNGKVSEAIAREFIRRSIWWFHPRAETEVPAPKFAWRVKGQDGDQRLRLGANTFLVGRAIQRCAATIESFISEVESSKDWTKEELLERLRRNVCGSVAKHNGEEYNGYYPMKGHYMRFGAHGIWVDHFIHAFDLSFLEDMPG